MAHARSRALAAALVACSTFAALPAAAAGECEDAQSGFWRAWAAEGERFTRPVALAARAVVDACPPDAPSSSAEADAASQAEAQTVARLCGFAGTATSPPTPASVRGWIMVGPKQVEDAEEGTGTATFDAATGHVRVQATGVKWAIDASNRGSGVITYMGVPFPLHGGDPRRDVVQADAGCGVPPGPTLCWGTGYGWSQVPFVGAISAAGTFHGCS